MTSGQLKFVAVLMALVMTGCASSMSGDVYSRDQARKLQQVQDGKVIMVREVQIEGSKSGIGAIAGGIMGFALGSTIGGGSGKTVASAAGTVIGGVAGGVGEKAATKQNGLEITVQLKNGEVVSIVQAADREYIVGDEVKVLTRANGEARVIQ